MFRVAKAGKPHPGAIQMQEVKPDLPADAVEIARLWVSSDRSFVAVAHQREWSPELLGSLFVECLLTAADACAAACDMSVEEALTQLWKGVDDERLRLSGGFATGVH